MFTKENTASFDVDPQNTFTELCPLELPIKGGQTIVAALNKQATFARLRVLSRDAHSPLAKWIATDEHPQFSKIENEKNLDIYWNSHAIVGTFGFDLISGLDIETYNYQVLKGVETNKHPYGACYQDLENKESAGVIEFLKQNNIKNVVVGGLALDYCVKETCLQLVSAGFTVYLNLSATKPVTELGGIKAIEELKKAGVITIELGE